MRAQTLAHLALLVAARLLASMALHGAGFEALSDDDYARIAIAQAFAHAPRVDPSGTSWLPLPFWATGAAMLAFGRSLEVANALGHLASCAAVACLYTASRAAGVEARSALAACLLACLSPVALFTGAASVPDLPVAMLCASALVLLRRTDARAALASSALVLAATLSRYEAWPVALVVCVAPWVPARTSPNDGTERDGRLARGASAAASVAASAAALLGPAAWMAWNASAHGHALHFHTRVSSYHAAVGAPAATALGWLRACDPAVLVEALAVVTGAAFALRSSPRRDVRAWSRPAAGGLVVIASLAAAAATGGAPTHHPERSLLMIGAVAWVAIADLMGRASPPSARVPRPALGAILALAALFATTAVTRVRTYGVDRTGALRVGAWLRANAAPGERVLVDPVDYGHFAMAAAFGAPERVSLSRSLDPRLAPEPSAFSADWALRARLARAPAAFLVARDAAAQVASAFGDVAHAEGAWRVVRVRAADATEPPSR